MRLQSVLNVRMKKLALFPLPGHNEYTLANGLRIIHQPAYSNVAYCGFAVDAGTRDELENEQGMAHFVEHLIFKGTQKRKAWHILNRMENVGGDLNAYTNKEETVIYSAFLTEHFGRAFELLADIVFHSTFPQREIEKETEVIIDEIQSYEDTPSELIFDDFEDLIFRGHPLGRNILGNPELLKTFRSEDAAAFTSRFYHPGNMVFFVWGDLDFKQVIRWAEKLLIDVPAVSVDNRRMPPPLYTPEKLTIHKDMWLLGSLYYNPADTRVMVAKRLGLGTTVNLATPVGKWTMAVLVVIIVGSLFVGPAMGVADSIPTELELRGSAPAVLVASHGKREKYTLSADRISDVQLRDSLPACSRTVGTGLDHYLEGDFYVTGEGQAYFCLDPTAAVFLRVEANGIVYWFTGDSAEETQAVANALEKGSAQ